MMEKITLEEKIKLITAYAEGKPIEVYNEDESVWETKIYDDWNFEEGEYRIKPEAATKFKVGDIVVVRECDEDWMMPDRRTIERLKGGICHFADGSDIKIEDLDIHYVNERDVLWYFELYDYATKKYSMHPNRMTIPEIAKEYASNHDTLKWWAPMYNLGFKLKEN